jgi:hypothetical protein
VQESEVKIAQSGRVHTLTRWWTRYGDNGGEDSVDGGGDQRQEVAGDGEDDLETSSRQSWTGAGEGFRRNFQKSTRGYIYPDPVGVTELSNSVAPRCRIASGYCNSVRPNCSNWLHRDWNLDQLNELGMTERNESVRPKYIERFWKFKSMTNRWLRVLLTQRVRIWLDQTLWCSMNRVWDEKSIDS